MVNKNFLKEKWLYPQTEPDQQGRTRKLGIELNEFNGDVELMKFHYSFGKGEGLYFTAGYTVCVDIFETLRTVMQKPEKVVFKWEDAKGKKAPVSLHVGRDENLTPFFALSGEIPGVGARQKKFYFTYPKGYRVFRNGQLLDTVQRIVDHLIHLPFTDLGNDIGLLANHLCFFSERRLAIDVLE